MRNVSTILWPTDFSEGSRHALDHAAVLARWYDARIVALHIYHPLLAPVPSLELAGYGRSERGERVARQIDPLALHADLQAVLNRTTTGLMTDARVESGAPAAQILECAERLPADLIVMGTHGHGGFERFLLGSVTEKVLRKAAVPVLTVPPKAAATSTLPFKRLLCPVDFSEPSTAALRFALSLAQEGDAMLTILHVLEWPLDGEPLTSWPMNVTEYRVAREREAEAALRSLVPDSVRDWCQPITRIAYGKPYREVLRVADDDRIDLIVMGVHGRNVVDRLLFGSTTTHIVRQATCPVLTLRD